MTVYGKLTIENQSAIDEKAKVKNDGIYEFRGIAYRVRNRQVTHYACRGEVVFPYGAFNVTVATYDEEMCSAKKALKSI